MADPAKYKSLSVPRKDWEQLGELAIKTNRTRSKMIGRLIKFFMENKGNGKKITRRKNKKQEHGEIIQARAWRKDQIQEINQNENIRPGLD